MAGIIFGVGVYRISKTYKLSPSWLWDIARGNSARLKQSNERTNIVLLGVGGNNHDGADLTDTIIVVSLGLHDETTLLLSIPRDVWIPSFKDKINSAYHYGEEKVNGGGLTLTKSAVEEIIGLPIHYAILIDFSSFKEFVDIVGGVDVNIDETFTDTEYPIAGKEDDLCEGDIEFKCRYETITFKQGVDHMDGDRALKYVRSRHATGDAGTDYSRNLRQQAVLLGLKNKIISWETLTNWQRLTALNSTIKQTMVTDLTLGEELLLSRLGSNLTKKVTTAALTLDEPEKQKRGLLINPPTWQYDNKWVLVPKADDFSRIKDYVKCLYTTQTKCEDFLN